MIAVSDTPSEDRADAPSPEPAYEPPVIIDLGRIRALFRGNASSGNADANSQYYW
ncbi:hypothetical protein GCM10012289_63210 [Nonomuraea cavernae]|uniref:Lasso RiPP family leader peptide-containing protein n=1 Tax=Nonomuraea cavernae TaxID=2045107 RepID=A0A918DQX8_9ACTN|nr:hypothetical protein GCM10012289_63210 [Nonomuraea cavernae]